MDDALPLLVACAVLLAAIAVAAARRFKERAADRVEARLAAERAARETYQVLLQAIRGLESSGEYLAASDLETWSRAHAAALGLVRDPGRADHLPAEEAARYRLWCQRLRDLPATVRELNGRFVAGRIAAEKDRFDRVERYPLTGRQRQAIVTDEDSTLVVAGAGTGKTSTIVGKVDYLVRRGLAAPEGILVLAFARKAADELKERFDRLEGSGAVPVSTFHALGLRIVGEAEGAKPSLSPMAEDQRALLRFVRGRLREMLGRRDFQALIVKLLAKHLDEPPAGPAPETGDTAIRDERARGLRAIDGTKLKSRQEVRIANWLTLNGIRWEYERPYPVPTATPWHRQYQPDFYLPDHDLYLEHFGIDRFGNTAPHVDRDGYLRAMEWKRELHREYGTALVETFSHFDDDGGLVDRLEELLRAHCVVPAALTDEEIAAIADEANRPFSDFVSLMAQFLTLFKGGGADRAAVQARARSPRDHLFLAVFWPVYEAYEAELAQAGQIDFNDMINRARGHVRSGKFRAPWRYVVVDEFQDISENRLGLIRDLLGQHRGGRLFAVGDDWQSIFRFAGSDVGIITDLGRWVGPTERVDLDVTFRYPQELLDASAAFVTANPAQLRKALRAHDGASGEPPLCVVFDEGGAKGTCSVAALETALGDILVRVPDRVDGREGRTTVFLIGRYRFNEPEIPPALRRELAAARVEVAFLTAHGSKGKEADFVVVLGLEAGEYGFPSNVADDPVTRMVLSTGEEFPYAEERRLFYVAMTRARQRAYLIAPRDNASPFVAEDLLGDAMAGYVETIGEASARHRCPRCQGHTIRRATGQHGAFWACGNYPQCRGRLDACPWCRQGGLVPADGPVDQSGAYHCTDCGRTAEGCPGCGKGYLRERNGPYGAFLGCSRWEGGRGCSFTRNLATPAR